MTEDSNQLEFDFFRQPGEFDIDGLAHWRLEMRAQDEAEARRLGLPLRRQVEVQLESGALLRGRLEFAEAGLLRLTRRPAKLALRVGDSVFDHSQIARCIVLD